MQDEVKERPLAWFDDGKWRWLLMLSEGDVYISPLFSMLTIVLCCVDADDQDGHKLYRVSKPALLWCTVKVAWGRQPSRTWWTTTTAIQSLWAGGATQSLGRRASAVVSGNWQQWWTTSALSLFAESGQELLSVSLQVCRVAITLSKCVSLRK